MSCECPTAACVSLSLQVSAGAAVKLPSEPQLCALARKALMRASICALKSAMSQVPEAAGAGAGAGVPASAVPESLLPPQAARNISQGATRRARREEVDKIYIRSRGFHSLNAW